MQALIRSVHPGAEAIDGSGGDGGRDTSLRTSEGHDIFEIKSYTERLKPGQVGKIKNSLRNAARFEPRRWSLIIPLNHSPSEDAWWGELKSTYPEIDLSWCGIDWLDVQFASRTDLWRYIEGEQYHLLELAQQFERERAALSKGLPDLDKRLRSLTRLGKDLSPFWEARPVIEGDDIGFAFREKYPGAASDDPITIKSVIEFKKGEEDEIAAKFRRALDYGGSVTVPGKNVLRFDVDASDETRRAFGWSQTVTSSQIHIRSIEDRTGFPLPCIAELRTADGELVTSLTLQMVSRKSGKRGLTVKSHDASEMLVILFRLDHDHGPGPTGNAVFDFELKSPIGMFPFAVRPVADFLAAFKPTNRLGFKMGNSTFASCEIREEVFADRMQVARLIVALHDLQDYFGTPFTIPGDLRLRDAVELEAFASLARNGRALWPYRRITTGFKRDRLNDFLSEVQLPAGGGALVAHYERLGMTVGEHELSFEHIQLSAPKVVLTNIEQLRSNTDQESDPVGVWECRGDSEIELIALSDDEWQQMPDQ